MKAMTAWLDDRAANHEFSGVAMGWVGGSPVFSHAAGLAHRGLAVPMTVDHRFRVASVTKMVTATTVMRLVERGVLGLNTPVVDLLEADSRPTSVTPAMTIHHLLSHTSGLANYHDEDDETFDSYMACWDVVPPQRAREPGDLLPLFVDKPALFGPGDRYSYADANYIMLGIIVATVTGSTFRQVASEEVLEPAGMTSSTFDPLDSDPEALAIGYQTSDEPSGSWRTNTYANAVGGMPDGGLITTAADLGRFIEAFRNGAFVSDESRAAMLTVHGRSDEDEQEHYGYGMELWVDEHDEVMIFGHSGSDPGISTVVSHFVDDEATIVTLCNYDRGSWAASKMLAAEMGVMEPRD
jgi:CubicO group peptidase (beta-lactamase class C family)